MVCVCCKEAKDNLIYIESHHDLIDDHICPICLAALDRQYLRQAINAGFIVTQDKMNLTNKYNSFYLPIYKVRNKNNQFMFSLEEEPDYDFVFSINESNVTRLRFIPKKNKKV